MATTELKFFYGCINVIQCEQLNENLYVNTKRYKRLTSLGNSAWFLLDAQMMLREHIKEIRHRILWIFPVLSLFGLVRVYISLHFLPIVMFSSFGISFLCFCIFCQSFFVFLISRLKIGLSPSQKSCFIFFNESPWKMAFIL